jgi:V8-like Glu-specific endopeptidase
MLAWGIFLIIRVFASFSHASDFNPEGGGVVVPQSQYPQAIQIETAQGRCSAAIVGPNVLLTAAHCAYEKDSDYEDVIPEGKTGMFYYQNQKYMFEFLPSTRNGKNIRTGEAPDLALGFIMKSVPNLNPLSINFESPSASQKMIALGFGCVPGKLTETLLKIFKEDNLKRYLRSLDPSRNTYACQGDSGGPTLTLVRGRLELVGVHVGTDLLQEVRDIRTNSEAFRTFIRKTVTQYNLEICGYNLNCHSSL